MYRSRLCQRRYSNAEPYAGSNHLSDGNTDAQQYADGHNNAIRHPRSNPNANGNTTCPWYATLIPHAMAHHNTARNSGFNADTSRNRNAHSDGRNGRRADQPVSPNRHTMSPGDLRLIGLALQPLVARGFGFG